MKQLIRYLIWFLPLFAGFNLQAQNNTVYGAGISYTNGVPSWVPNPRTSRAVVDTVTGRWYHFNTPGGWQWIGNTVEEIAGCAAPAYTPNKGDSRLVINNCLKPQVFWYDGAVWKWINEGTTYFPGEGIRIENDTIILDSLYVLRFRTGDTTDLNAGTVSWNAAEQTLDVVINQGAVTGQMFQEVLYFTKNQTGVQINDGAVVMAAGTTGNSGKILIAPAIADGSVNSEYILGLATQNIPNGGEGMVTHFGKVRGIQTNGANYGETWVDGDVLYCSAVTPGYLTKVLPTAPSLKVPIAIVINAHTSNGTLFVRPSHFPDLAQINDVQLSSPTNGQVLTYNSALSRWENATPANQLQTLSTDNTPGNISISSGNTITLNVNDADASTTNELQTLSTGTNTLTLSNGGGTVTVDTNPANDVTGSGANGQIAYFNGTQTVTSSTGLTYSGGTQMRFTATSPSMQINGTSNDAPFGLTYLFNGVGRFRYVFDNSTNRWFLQGADASGDFTTTPSILVQRSTSNFVGINLSANSSPQSQFTVNGNTFIGGNVAASARLEVRGSGTSSSTWTAQFHNSAGNNNALMIRDDGNVGIGTSSLTAQLNVKSRPTNAPLTVRDSADNIVFSTNNSRTTFFGSNDGYNGTVDINLTNHASRVAKIGALEFTRGGGPSWTGQGLRIDGPNRTFIFNVSNGNTTDLSAFALSAGAALQNVGFSSRTSGTIDWMVIENASYRPTSGTGVFNQFTIKGEIQQTGGANGITRGVYVQPTITSAANWRSFEFSNNAGWGFYGAGNAKNYFAGNTAIGTTAQNASAAFEVASTTQGVLFPRMTTTQRNAIATPADGLVIYNTTDNKLQVRAGGAWVDLH